MKHPITGETATPLTAAMVEALRECIQCDPTPHFVPNQATAVALLNRGWITKANVGEHISTRSLYYVTARGRMAYKIGKRAPGCMPK